MAGRTRPSEGGKATAARRRRRLSPDDRRRVFLDAATEAFAERGYRDTSTIQLARAAGVTQPLLYRHFSGKAELYVACLEAAWQDLLARWQAVLDDEPDPVLWMPQISLEALQTIGGTARGQLWIRAIAEASAEPAICQVVARTLREAHDFLRRAFELGQQRGVISPDVVPAVEAWQFIGTGLLVAASDRLGGIVGDDIWEMLRVGHERTAALPPV